ncbi:uncharacterized protein LOC113493288 [Trichoplusia ni]|uniref:Uncharacterized protein LOC113493288 n=1 Tax=Trichoplusia ni TaxID=7111 RepID=A0A7E5VFA5_TRINI|nr:uncharacterized protein LOC113493288 [Trichoplusia ni]XP_026726999.1 uncharacterized protein LOC113493288 [Trichoplusia ni]
MNNDTAVEGRPRPLSSGIWTLFSWLRRDERSASSESLSSAGSDRTVASFAFLTPAHFTTKTGPIVVAPPGSPTDSYKRRVHDRNLRRHHDRDITLHRKYGLFKSEITNSYDAFSLPPLRRINGEPGSRWDRDRRATSECYQRRLAHVPGKRRAPLPPIPAASLKTSAGPTSLSRRSTRKRRAPQPPVKHLEKNKDNLKDGQVSVTVSPMNSKVCDDPKLTNNHVNMGCKSEKYCKKEATSKETKHRTERSFLKQIFDSKKRNSAIDTASVKILPSISELDKQAAEIIESSKSKSSEQNNNITLENILSQHTKQGDSWFCIRCLRKYDSTVETCHYCLPGHKIQSSAKTNHGRTGLYKASNSSTQTEKNTSKLVPQESEEKQKLKEMLKEMKDSLPKRPKHDNKSERKANIPENDGSLTYSTETPTLRVGATMQDEKKLFFISQPSTSNINSTPEVKVTNKPYLVSPQSVLVSQVISAYKKNLNNNLTIGDQLAKNNDNTNKVQELKSVHNDSKVPMGGPKKVIEHKSKDKNILHTPLKISSLLNPVYIPKNTVSEPLQLINNSQLETKNKESDKICQVPKTPKEKAEVHTTSAEILAVPSTSRDNILISNILNLERKNADNLHTKKTIKEKTPPSTSKNSLQTVTNDVKDALGSKLNNSNQSKLPILTKDQNSPNILETQNQHARRRELINQLEKSIAKGDERAAAEAAAKLAQLRLSCSVLSFSSQILSQPSTSSNANNIVKIIEDRKQPKNEKAVNDLKSATEAAPPKVTTNDAGPSSNKTNALITANMPVQKEGNSNLLQKDQALNKDGNDKKIISIAVLVEDREATRGPVHLRINRHALMKDLRREAETTLGLATNLQRWIVGRTLCVDDNTPIISLAGPGFNAPFYLCVVDSETRVDTASQSKINAATGMNKTENLENKTGDVYTELVQLEQQALVPNAESFECGICIEEYPPGQGVVLRECVHIFCKECLADVVRHCEEPNVPCPAMGCKGMLQEREIRALVTPQDYERWLARGLAAAESGTRNAFHCRTRDCKGWALCEPGVRRFPCPVCKCINCVPCKAIHPGETCEQHREKLKQTNMKSVNTNETDDGTRTLLNSLIRKGEALECPECSAIITKKWGCDWVKCSACKTEICWVTRGRRWGPGGKGDITGGCRCGVDGKRCHPSCGYCH